MRKEDFIQTEAVTEFVKWLSEKLPQLTATLEIKSSAKVPGGVNETIRGVEKALVVYKWRASWIDEDGSSVESMDWRTTSDSLQRLGTRLRTVLQSEGGDVLEVCRQILRWGGNRSATRGALPFLEQRDDLRAYLIQCANALSLNSADLGANTYYDPLRVVREMNSMLTKVHALASEDGLPIYDSRVAATIATLVEMWRRDSGRAGIPELLVFPCLSVVRSPLSYAADAPDPEILSYDKSQISERTRKWVSAKVRLGWIMDAVLRINEKSFSQEGVLSRRMHALEAALFVLGYDVSCLSEDDGVENRRDDRIVARTTRSADCLKVGEAKIGHTLTQKRPFQYFGNIEDGICIQYKSGQNLAIEPDQIDEILQQLEEWKSVKCGASQDAVQDDTLAAWLVTSGRQLFKRKITGQHVSHIAAVLVQESGGRIISEQKKYETEKKVSTWITYKGE